MIEAGGAAIEGPFDGEESITLMADLDAGATGMRRARHGKPNALEPKETRQFDLAPNKFGEWGKVPNEAVVPRFSP